MCKDNRNGYLTAGQLLFPTGTDIASTLLVFLLRQELFTLCWYAIRDQQQIKVSFGIFTQPIATVSQQSPMGTPHMLLQHHQRKSGQLAHATSTTIILCRSVYPLPKMLSYFHWHCQPNFLYQPVQSTSRLCHRWVQRSPDSSSSRSRHIISVFRNTPAADRPTPVQRVHHPTNQT